MNDTDMLYLFAAFIGIVIVLVLIYISKKHEAGFESAREQNCNRLNYLISDLPDLITDSIVKEVCLEIQKINGKPISVSLDGHLGTDYGLDSRQIEDLFEWFSGKYNIYIDPKNPVELPSDPTIFNVLEICSQLLRKAT